MPWRCKDYSIGDNLPPIALEIDHELARIEKELRFLLNVTPTNAAEAWADFEKGGFAHPPALQTRPLTFDPEGVRRQLYNLEVEKVEDPIISRLFLEKRDELSRGITLLVDRDTSRFLYGSLSLFGEVGEGLIQDARKLLDSVSHEVEPDTQVTATAFAEEAQTEFDRYRQSYPGFSFELEIRDDVADLMVSHGRLLIPSAAVFRARRVVPLIQHEVGTHVVTYANGSAQDLQLLATGLPGYEETQEGLAVLAEYAIGGLDPLRVRLLAARVIAVQRVIEGEEFLSIFQELHEAWHFSAKTAWDIAVRVTRNGGLTKDVIYLRGISRILEHAAERKDISALLVGKLSLEQVPLVEELLQRGILRPPWIRPRWLDDESAQSRLKRVYDGLSVTDLLHEDAA